MITKKKTYDTYIKNREKLARAYASSTLNNYYKLADELMIKMNEAIG
jgi:hypothetical protein